jgi:dihydroorotate dehydrogenase electron transfer subunit
MILQTPIKIIDIQPGQFVQVKIEGSPATFLRRPISICMADQNELWLLVQIVGQGSTVLSKTEPGDLVNIIAPLGKGFSLPETNENVLLIGGGVGVAPLLLLGKQLSVIGKHVVFLLGARTSSDIVLKEEFLKYGEVFSTTEDGSAGEKGLVTDHSLLEKRSFERIYSCGPKPMMQAVAKFAKKKNITCEVSLENLMACGIGACLCCVEDTKEGNVCSCTEGPVFNTNLLKW